jgi:hypothetical protein
MNGSNRVDLLQRALSEIRDGVAESGRILERRSGDPEMDCLPGIRQPGLWFRSGAEVNWR